MAGVSRFGVVNRVSIKIKELFYSRSTYFI